MRSGAVQGLRDALRVGAYTTWPWISDMLWAEGTAHADSVSCLHRYTALVLREVVEMHEWATACRF